MENAEQLSLFGDDFEIKIPEKSVKETIKKATKKVDAETDPEKVLKSKKLALNERLAIINTNVLRILGKQKNNVLVIKDKATLDNYVSEAIKAGRIAIDTETNNSLDPITCKLMGPCLYYPGGKQAYIPVNHRDPDTKERLSWQLTEEDCKEAFQKINDSEIEQIFHNGKFDYEVIKCTCGIAVKPTWDTMIGARLLNENELAGLKWQYTNKIDKTQEKYDIEKLFENVAYADVDPDIFALYAATDSMMTDKLYELQKVELDKEEYGPHLDITGTHELKGLRWLFHEVEMPISIVTAEMELRGVAVDEAYGARLKEKYNNQLEQVDNDIAKILSNLQTTIDTWSVTPQANEKLKTYASKKSKMSKEKLEATYPNEDQHGRYKVGKAPVEILENPINLASPAQLAVLFYDILGVDNSSKDGGRKTGKDELKSIKETLSKYLPKLEELETDFDEEDLNEEVEEAVEMSTDEKIVFKLGSAAKLADLILKRRGIAKLVTTYIDVIPELVKHWPDHRIRFHLNSLGTDTGRYSSGGKLKFMENDEAITVSGINIQNIPSHNPEIRMLFTAAPGHRIIGSDYSAQEPRMTTFLSGDSTMYKAYNEGKDLYAMIAQSAFDNNYEDNLEFYPAGTEIEIDGQKVICGKKTHLNKAGKERRSVGKVLNLAATYGMGGSTAGARLGKSKEEGQLLLDNFFKGFSGVKKAIDDSKVFLKQTGYVEDFIGRRRRLSDINLPPYEAQLKENNSASNFNPFITCTNRITTEDEAVYIWNQILMGYIILSNVWHLAKDPASEIKNELPNSTFEKYKKIAGNPEYYFKQLYDPAKKASPWNRLNKEKILDDMQALQLVLTDRVYRNEPVVIRSELETIIADYQIKYGNSVPRAIPETPVLLLAWTGRIAQASRQCFNARIQGSAATLTKMAMVDIYNDAQLREWNAHLIITVHDEVLVECPEEYAELVEKRLPEIMINAAKKGGDDVPQACDPYNVTRWYSDTAAASIMDEFKKLELGDKDRGILPLPRDKALAKVIKSHTEIPEAAIIKTIETGCDLDF